MVRGTLYIVAGVLGLVACVLLAVPAPAFAEFGPCNWYVGGACRCSWDSTNQYWFYCENHHWDNSFCQGFYGLCNFDPDRPCFADMNTNRVKCDDGACGINCGQISVQCKLWTADCLHP